MIIHGVSVDATDFRNAKPGLEFDSSSATALVAICLGYTATGNARFRGPKAEVDRWTVGYVQNVTYSQVNVYYGVKGEGLCREKTFRANVKTPVLDRDPAGNSFWWADPGAKSSCANINPMAFATAPNKDAIVFPDPLVDKPFLAVDWHLTLPDRGTVLPLHSIQGRDRFSTFFVAAYRIPTGGLEVNQLSRGDWAVDWAIQVVDINSADPRSRAQAPGTAGCSTVPHEGAVGVNLEGPIANESYTTDNMFYWE